MMKKSIDSPFRKLKMLLVLPLIAMVFYAFAKPEYISLPATSTGTHTITTITDALNELKAPNNAPVDKSEKATQDEKGKIVKGTVVNADGKPLPGTSVILAGFAHGTMTDKEGHFELKDVPNGGELEFSFVGLETVRVKADFKKPMTIKMVPATVGLDKVVVVGYANPNGTPPPPPPAGVAFNSADFSKNPPLIILDGDIIDKTRMDAIKPDNIESISVLKDKSATLVYGEKAKNGVILITTKKNQGAEISSIDPLNPPLYVTDGVITDKRRAQYFLEVGVESVEVLKGKAATDKYGDKGKNGVILITLKKNQGASNGNKLGDVEVVGFGMQKDHKSIGTTLQSDSGITIRSGSTDPQNPPLYVLDGVIVDKTAIDALNPSNDIALIEVLKDKSATDLYGDKGKNGVILITSKGKASADQKADKATQSETKGKEVFIVVEAMPEFPGGKEALMKFIQTNIKYPAEAQKAKAHGSVIVTFVVNSNGKVERTKVVRSVYPALDAEALRLVNSMPDWQPARQRGVAVDVAYTLPIEFTLQ